jgi:hypothetical protein
MSSEIDLHQELFAAVKALTQNHWQHLAVLGFDRSASLCVGGIGIARAQIERGVFVPSAEGATALIWPVWTGPISPVGYCEGDLVDLVAWHPARANHFARRTGYGIALGMAAIERAASAGPVGALKLFRTPFAWAIAGGDSNGGAVILEWKSDNGLFNVAKLVCEDAEHADKVEHRLDLLRLLLVPRHPLIQFTNPKERTA